MKRAICVALVLVTAGVIVGRAMLSSRRTPVALPVTAAMMRPASAHGGVPPPSGPHDDAADIDAPGLCSSPGEGPPARLRRPAIPADGPETQRSLDLARDHESHGDAREAERLYRSLLEENWSNAQAHAGLGRALSSLGDLPEAEAHLQRAVLLEPGDTRTRLDLAAVQVWLLHYPSARQQIQALIDADPGGVHADAARTLLQLVDALDAPG